MVKSVTGAHAVEQALAAVCADMLNFWLVARLRVQFGRRLRLCVGIAITV